MFFYLIRFREEYLIVLNCFQSSRTTRSNNIHHGLIQRPEKKSKINSRKPSTSEKRREIAMKKVKHSIFIDDMPAEYRSFAFGYRRSNDQKCLSTSSMLLPTSEYDDISSSRKASTSRLAFLNNKSNGSPTMRLTLNTPTNSAQVTTSISDDGGVYCGS